MRNAVRMLVRSCLANECVVERLLVPVRRRGVLGMPLHSHQPSRFVFERLDEAIGRTSADTESGCDTIDSLVMERCADDVDRADGIRDERVLLERDRMQDVVLAGRELPRCMIDVIRQVTDVLDECATERDVHELDASTHCEHRQPQFQCGKDECRLEVVLFRHDAVDVGTSMLTVEMRIHVTAAHQHQSVESLEEIGSFVVADFAW